MPLVPALQSRVESFPPQVLRLKATFSPSACCSLLVTGLCIPTALGPSFTVGPCAPHLARVVLLGADLSFIPRKPRGSAKTKDGAVQRQCLWPRMGVGYRSYKAASGRALRELLWMFSTSSIISGIMNYLLLYAQAAIGPGGRR